MIERRIAKKVKIGNIFIGQNEKILVQSMLNKPWNDFGSNVSQAIALEKAGCEIIRVAVPTKESVKLIEKLKQSVNVPVVADIHFDYNLAIESVFAGADKIRINPGNIEKSNLKKIVIVCRSRNIPIRIGINSGSVEKEFLNAYGRLPDAMVNSAMQSVRFFENLDFDNIILSIKSTNVIETIESYEKISKLCDYPLHIGITESGTINYGTIKSCVGIGSLLSRGIGDTIRISLTADPLNEVDVGFQILKSLGLSKGVEVFSCPTCGRTTINVEKIAKSVEEMTKNIRKNLKIAVMGCPVNGPGESFKADFGITGLNGEGIIFSKGKIIKKVPENQLLLELKQFIDDFSGE